MLKLISKNLHLTTPSQTDLAAIIDFEKRNKVHLAKWETSIYSDDDQNLTLDKAVEKRLDKWIKECEENNSIRFFLRPIDDPESIIGFCNFTQIFHGAFKACYLGYKIDYEYEGKGLMFEALETSIKYVFEEMGLHRIMANYMPINIKSAKLLNRLGFEVEGYAKNYLNINHRWEDHILTALSLERWQNLQLNLSSQSSKLENADYHQKDVHYREVQMNDLNPIISLMEQLGYPIEKNAMVENLQNYMTLPHQKAWVAEKLGHVIGCIAVAKTNFFHLPGCFLRIITLVVDEKNRRLGLGKNLIEIAEKYAAELGCSHIELTSGVNRAKLGSHQFYQSLGYSDLGDTKKYFGKLL